MKNSDLVETTVYKALSELFGKLFVLLMLPVIIRLLPREEIGVIGVVAGYITLISLGNICPENILIRNYFKVRDRDFKLSSYLNFSILKFGIMALVILGLSVLMPDMWMIMVLQAAAVFFGGMAGFFGFVYYVKLEQKFATSVQVLSQVVGILITFYLLTVHRTVMFYYLGIFLVSLMSLAFFLAISEHEFTYTGFRKGFGKQMRAVVDSLEEFSFWNYLSGFTTSIMYTISPAILAVFAGMEDVGNITICIMIADFYFIVPMVVQGTGTIALSNLRRGSMIRNMTVYELIISLVTLLGFILLGNHILGFISGSEESAIYSNTILMLLFATVLNAARPLMSEIIAEYDMKKAFFAVFMPTMLFNIGSLTYFSATGGFIGAVWGNSLSYLFFAVMIALYYRLGERDGR